MIRLALFLGCLALPVAVMPPPVEACYMEAIPVEVGPKRADALLVMARERMDEGRWKEAVALVRRVAASGLVKPAQKAEALAVLGWAGWRDRRPSALASLRRARALDGDALERVLARTRAPEQVTALRAALAG